jgi:hypothetical protein
MNCSYFPLYMSKSQEKKARLIIRGGVVAGGQAGGHRAGSIFESSASDAHTDPPWPPLTACDDGPLATPRPSGQPILERPPPPVHRGPSLPGRQDGTTVLYGAQLFVAIYTHRKAQILNLVYCSFALTLLSYLLLVSTVVTRLLPPTPASRLTMGKSLTLSQMAAAAYQPVFLPYPHRHSSFINSIAVPAYPVVRSWSHHTLLCPPRPIYSLPPTPSRVLIP